MIPLHYVPPPSDTPSDSQPKKKELGQWGQLVEPHVKRLRLHGLMGLSYVMKPPSSLASAQLLETLGAELDNANRRINDMQVMLMVASRNQEPQSAAQVQSLPGDDPDSAPTTLERIAADDPVIGLFEFAAKRHKCVRKLYRAHACERWPVIAEIVQWWQDL